MKRILQLVALLGIAGLVWYLWQHFGHHVEQANASSDRKAALDYQKQDWALPWEQPINAYNYLAADIARAIKGT